MKTKGKIVDLSLFSFWAEALQHCDTVSNFLTAIEQAKSTEPIPPQTLTLTYKNRGLEVELPANCYFLMCYLAGTETDNDTERRYFYSKAVTVYEQRYFAKFREFSIYKDRYTTMKPFYTKGIKPSYEVLYGTEIAELMRANLKEKMSSLSRDTVERRNRSISLGMLKHHSQRIQSLTPVR